MTKVLEDNKGIEKAKINLENNNFSFNTEYDNVELARKYFDINDEDEYFYINFKDDLGLVIANGKRYAVSQIVLKGNNYMYFNDQNGEWCGPDELETLSSEYFDNKEILEMLIAEYLGMKEFKIK
jgi:hypothetical protein